MTAGHIDHCEPRNPNALDPAVARAIAPIRAARLESKRREGHGKPATPSRRMSAHRFDVVTMAEVTGESVARVMEWEETY